MANSSSHEMPLMEPLKGRNGSLIIYRDFVEIDRTTSKVFSLIGGLYGKKRIYYRDIGSIQFKKTGLAVGFIQFSILGGKETKGIFNATKDENTITFGQDNKKWENAHNYIRQVIDENKKRSIQKDVITNDKFYSFIDELKKASDLLEKGLITKEEFNNIKEKLLQ